MFSRIHIIKQPNNNEILKRLKRVDQHFIIFDSPRINSNRLLICFEKVGDLHHNIKLAAIDTIKGSIL